MKQYLSVISQGEANCSIGESCCAPSCFVYFFAEYSSYTNSFNYFRNNDSRQPCNVSRIDYVVLFTQMFRLEYIVDLLFLRVGCCCWWDRSWSMGVRTRARHWTRRAKVEGSGLRAPTPWPWTRASFAC